MIDDGSTDEERVQEPRRVVRVLEEEPRAWSVA